MLSHSFRAGLVTLLARSGWEENKIKEVGRWRSNAWMKYAKEGRRLRQGTSRRINSLVIRDSVQVRNVQVVSEDDLQVSWN